MYKLVFPEVEYFNELTSEFAVLKETSIVIEHSLVSVSKWESRWKKPFLSNKELTAEEAIDYIRCMTITQNVDPKLYNRLTNSMIEEVSKYINDPMTATTIKETDKRGSREIITSEIIYYWMIALEIPMECQKWHLNRLLTLIKVCNIKNSPGKKMSKSAIYKQNSALNAARRKAHNTTG